MSAFQVPAEHIGALVRFAILGGGPHASRPYWKNSPLRYEDGDEIMAALALENARSVSARYADDPGSPVVCESNLRVYRELTPIEACKAIDCLDYQSCEHDEWPTTAACAFLQALYKSAVHRMAGWSDADAWPVTEDAGAHRARLRADLQTGRAK